MSGPFLELLLVIYSGRFQLLELKLDLVEEPALVEVTIVGGIGVDHVGVGLKSSP